VPQGIPANAVVTAASEPVLPPAPPTLTVEPAGTPTGSVDDCLEARALLWSELDSTAALTQRIEQAARNVAGTPSAGVAAHARLTAGLDLVAELRAVESAVAAEAGHIQKLEGTIRSNEAEIARLNRNRMLMIGAIVAGVLILIILIATAL
jgi:hypothetical protein